MEIGAQFFTIREFCKTTDDFAESLKKIADIGYKNVQISGTCDYDPVWLNAELQKNGLKCVLTHTPLLKMQTDPEKVIADHNAFNCNYIGLGSYPLDSRLELVENFIRDVSPVISAFKKADKYFMYHNHATELQKVEGRLIFDRLAEAFEADEMGFTLDTYWVQTAGGDPAYWLRQFVGRVPVIHLKDHTFDRKMAVVGEGNINFDRIFEEAENAGTEYMLVEQDDCYGENPFDCLKRSYEFLKSRGFE